MILVSIPNGSIKRAEAIRAICLKFVSIPNGSIKSKYTAACI